MDEEAPKQGGVVERQGGRGSEDLGEAAAEGKDMALRVAGSIAVAEPLEVGYADREVRFVGAVAEVEG